MAYLIVNNLCSYFEGYSLIYSFIRTSKFDNNLIWLEKIILVFNFLVLYKLRKLGPSKQIKMIRRLNASRLLIIRRLEYLLKNIRGERIRLKKIRIALEKKEIKVAENYVYLN